MILRQLMSVVGAMGVTASVLVATASSSAGVVSGVCSSGMCTTTIPYSGRVQQFVVPTGVSSVTVVVDGASGGSATVSGTVLGHGGGGGETRATLAVTPLSTLSLVIGGAGASTDITSSDPTAGAGGFGGGGQGGTGGSFSSGGTGGGGGSFLFYPSGSLAVAAGGGGGAGFALKTGGAGGSAATDATAGAAGDEGAESGQPGTGSGNGAGGAAGTNTFGDATAGTSGTGSVSSTTVLPVGGTGGNGGEAAGGGGGGYHAGGGGGGLDDAGAVSSAGGGGGAGYADPAATNVSGSTGARAGNGQITISWALPATPVSVQAPSSGRVGQPMQATATLGGVNPQGVVTFRVFGPGDSTCATALFTSPVAANGATPVQSAEYTPTSGGTYRWTATYTGDGSNGAGASGCDDPSATVVVGSRPTVTAVSPASGPAAGGQSVVITGTGLTGAIKVLFGSTQATSYTVDDDGQITAVAPAHVIGTVKVRVKTPGGLSAKSPAARYRFR